MSERITRRNPDALHETPGYHHVTIVEAGRLAFLAGQCPLGPDGVLAGHGNLDAQIGQIADNARVALDNAGARPEDVVRSVIYVVTPDQAVLSAAWDAFTASVIGPAFGTASTLLGVAQLGFQGQLVELDLTAAVS